LGTLRIAAAAAALLVALSISCRNVANESTPQTAEARGEEVFYQHCSVCHSADTDEVIVGPSLKGFFKNPSPAPLADGTVLPRTDAAVHDLFEKGTKNMPPVRGLSKQQLSDVVAFLHTL
jgi:mono/diheme cytochrome c family protein